MKIALLTDTHAGARNDATIFTEYYGPKGIVNEDK